MFKFRMNPCIRLEALHLSERRAIDIETKRMGLSVPFRIYPVRKHAATSRDGTDEGLLLGVHTHVALEGALFGKALAAILHLTGVWAVPSVLLLMALEGKPRLEGLATALVRAHVLRGRTRDWGASCAVLLAFSCTCAAGDGATAACGAAGLRRV